MVDKSPAPAEAAKPEAAAVTDEEISKAIDGAVKGFRGKADRSQVVGALRTAAELVNRDEEWAAKPEEKAEAKAEK